MTIRTSNSWPSATSSRWPASWLLTGERLADPCIRSTGVGNDDLKAAGQRAGTFEHDAGCTAVKCLTYKAVAVVTGAGSCDGNEQLAGFQPAMIIAAAGNFPVLASQELALGDQLSQAHRGNALFRQTVNEPGAIGFRLLAWTAFLRAGCLA